MHVLSDDGNILQVFVGWLYQSSGVPVQFPYSKVCKVKVLEEIKLIVGALKILHVIIYDCGPNWAPLSHITQLQLMAKKQVYNSFCVRISDH